MFLGAGSVMHGDGRRRRHAPLRRAAQGDAGHVPDLRDGLPRDHRLPAASPASGPRTRSSRPRSADNLVVGSGALLGAGVTGVLHDPADADDVLRREALGEGRAPARVAQGDDRPADRARRAVGRSAACCCSTTGSSTGSRRSSGRAEHHEPPLPAIVITLIIAAVVAARRRHRLAAVRPARGPARWPRTDVSFVDHGRAAPTSTATRSTRRSSCAPGTRLVARAGRLRPQRRRRRRRRAVVGRRRPVRPRCGACRTASSAPTPCRCSAAPLLVVLRSWW